MWITKYRKPALTGEIALRVRDLFSLVHTSRATRSVWIEAHANGELLGEFRMLAEVSRTSGLGIRARRAGRIRIGKRGSTRRLYGSSCLRMRAPLGRTTPWVLTTSYSDRMASYHFIVRLIGAPRSPVNRIPQLRELPAQYAKIEMSPFHDAAPP
ncbi:MAG: hypothetical protein ACKV2U_33430 [Bryobacteraceae bacterium]